MCNRGQNNRRAAPRRARPAFGKVPGSPGAPTATQTPTQATRMDQRERAARAADHPKALQHATRKSPTPGMDVWARRRPATPRSGEAGAAGPGRDEPGAGPGRWIAAAWRGRRGSAAQPREARRTGWTSVPRPGRMPRAARERRPVLDTAGQAPPRGPQAPGRAMMFGPAAAPRRRGAARPAQPGRGGTNPVPGGRPKDKLRARQQGGAKAKQVDCRAARQSPFAQALEPRLREGPQGRRQDGTAGANRGRGGVITGYSGVG